MSDPLPRPSRLYRAESPKAVFDRQNRGPRQGAGTCEVCGTRCPIAKRGRSNYTNPPPTTCSAYCTEVALQRRAKEK